MQLILSIFLVLFIASFSLAQGVGIGTVPNGSAMLDVNSTDKGLLAPRVALNSTLDVTTITNGNVISLLIYNTATAGIPPNNVVPGYYYWDGSVWKSLENKASHDWYEVGTMTGANNITNNIYTQGNVGIGTTNPGSGTTGQGGASFGSNVLEVSSPSRAILSLRTNNTTGLATMVMSANNGSFRDLHLNHSSDGDTYFTHYTSSGIESQFWFKNNGALGIGTDSPTAQLEVSATNEGILIPRVALVALNVATPLTLPTVSELIYNTATAGTAPNNVVPGYYYWDGSVWKSLENNASHDWYEVGTMTGANNITNNIYTQGNVGIGTTNPGSGTTGQGGASFGSNVLEVSSPSRAILSLRTNNTTGLATMVMSANNGSFRDLHLNHSSDGDTYFTHYTSSGIESQFWFKNNGALGIGTNTPTARLSVNGAASKPGGGTWAVFSDARLKKDITPYKEGLDLIKQVRPVNFSYNDELARIWGTDQGITDKVFQGVIAQDLQKIAPDMVRSVELENKTNQTKESFLEIDPNKFTYALINAVKEQQVIIEQQQMELEELKASVLKINALLK